MSSGSAGSSARSPANARRSTSSSPPIPPSSTPASAGGSTLLTADLVRARRRGDQLVLAPLDAAGRATALELAASLLGLAEAHLGKTRGELADVMDAIVGAAVDRKLAAGLAKLIWDRAELAEAVPI